jgi:hypothetical protein
MLDIPNLSAPKSKIKFLITEDTKLPAKGTLPPPPGSLEQATFNIRTNINEIRADADAIRKRAIWIGRDLIVVKTFIAKHGDFLDYVKAEFQMHPRTAQRYMRVWEFVETNPDFMDEAPDLSALYALTEGNFAPEVLESIKEAMKKGSVPKTKAGVKAIAAKTSSAVVKSKKPDPANTAADEAVAFLQKHLGADLATFAKLFRKAGAAFAPALKKAVA